MDINKLLKIMQQLFPGIDRTGRVVATEILVATSAVRNVVREQKTEKISTILQTGSRYGISANTLGISAGLHLFYIPLKKRV